jgi:hypothetical protein
LKKTDNGLSWGITFYSDAPTPVTGQVEKRGKMKTSHEVFKKKTLFDVFNLKLVM